MQINMPVDDNVINQLKIYDMVEITGKIFTGRDAVLPKIVKCIEEGTCEEKGHPPDRRRCFSYCSEPGRE